MQMFCSAVFFLICHVKGTYKTVGTNQQPKSSKYLPISGDLVPEFSDGYPVNLTVQRESSAFLDCPVKNPGDRPVSYPLISWVRIRDWHILTNGLVRFTTDDRFNVLYREGSFNWVLQIKFVQDRDGGIYECQVSTATGTISRRVQVQVVYPEAYIKGGEEYHVDEGSPISLTCVLDSTPSPPQYIFWYHNDRMVNYHVERGVKVETYTTNQETTESKLSFSNASKRDEGNYTCSPSNSVPATVQLYVTKRNSLSADPVMKQAVSAESKAALPYLGLNSFVIFLVAGIITLSSSSFRLF